MRRDDVLGGAVVALRQSLVRVAGVRAEAVVRERQALDTEAAVPAVVVGRAGWRHAPDRVVQLLGRVLDLHARGAHVGEAEAVRAPGRLRHDLVGHQAFEHPASEGRDEGQVRAGVDVVAFPDRERLPGLRVGVGQPSAGHRPLSLPREVRVTGWQSGNGAGGGNSRQLRHHTLPGIWCRPMPM